MKAKNRAPSSWRHIPSALLISLFLSLLNGCDRDSSSITQVTGVFVDDPVAQVTGVFVDDPVSGLEYQCPAGVVNTTNAAGEFICPAGSDVTFHVGPITLGPIEAASNKLVTPLNLFPGNTIAQFNLARLLQSIDTGDGNGTLVLDPVLLAAIPAQADITQAGFVSEVETAFGFALVTTAQANAHLNAEIAEYVGTSQVPVNAPQVNAGADQDVFVGDMVQLDGSATVDVDDDPLQYTWTFDSKPAGSATVFLPDPSAVAPSFTADVAGEYIVSLWAFDGIVMGGDQLRITAVPVQPGSNAALSDLSISAGILSPPFASTEPSYTVLLDNQVDSITLTPQTSDVLASVTVNGSAVASGSASNPIGLAVGTNVIPVVVTAADGLTSQNYSVIITRQQLQLSSNADLSALTFSSGSSTPPFSPAQLVYTLSVANSVNVMSVVPVASSAAASITVNGVVVNSGVASGPVNLAEGDNPISIVVLAEDGVTSRTYSVTVTRAQPLVNFDASLLNLALGPASGPAPLTPAFDPDTFTYSTTLDYVHSWVDVIPIASQSGATITVNNIPTNSGSSSGQIGLNVGLNTLHIVVTAVAGNGQSYFINVTRLPQSTDADLFDLSLSSGTLSPPFDAATPGYSAFVENAVTEVAVTAITSHQFAVVSVDSVQVTSGEASAALPLSVGDNIIPVSVLAQDGTTSRDYSINVVRADVADVTEGYLDTLILSEGDLTPLFNATIPSYTSVVPATTGTITLTPTPLHGTSTVTVNGADPSIPVSLIAGDNLIEIEVTSGDGTVTNTYTVNVTQGVPAAPQNFQALAGVSEVDLSWDAVNSALGYTVYYAAEPGVTTSSPVALFQNPATSFTFPGVNDVTYYFRVAGVNSQGQGALSAEVSATPQTFIPKNPRVNVSSGQNILRWSPLDNAESYTVYWNTSGSVTTADTSVAVGSNTSYTHLNLASGQAYHYRVSASANAVEGELSQEVAATQAPVGWSWVDPLPQGNHINDVTWGAGRYVAVGSFGSVLTSLNGASWSAQVSGTTQNLQAIAWSGDRFVAVGTNGVILSSENGLSWSVQSSGYIGTLVDVIWDGSRFIAVGHINPDIILTSNDGLRWTSAQPTFAGTVVAIAYDGVLYQILTSDGSSNSWVYRSTNLGGWTQHYLGPNGAYDITWGNGMFVIASEGLFYTSSDGINWGIPDDGGNTQNLFGVEWLSDRFLAVGSGTLLSSFDAVGWSVQAIDSAGRALQAITSSGSGFVAAGDSGTIVSSLDTASWTLHTTSVLPGFTDILWSDSDNQFVAVGSSTTATSANGLTWNTVQVSSALFNALSGNGNVYVAVGISGKVYSSANGSSWTQRDSKTTQTLEDITWDATLGQFFAVGWNGTIIASSDGINWAVKSPGVADRLLSITSSAGQLVAVGVTADFNDGSILTSLDGDDWTVRTSPESTFKIYNDVASSGDRFVIGSTPGLSAGTLLTSDDGITWTVQNFTTPGITFDSVTWDGSQFVVLTNFGQIYTSSDTTSWLSQVALTPLHAVAFDGSRILGISGSGVITNPAW